MNAKKMGYLSLWIGIGFALLQLAGSAYQSALERREAKQFRPPGKLYTVQHKQIHLVCSGQGQPTIVLESGLAGWSQDWSRVRPLLQDMGTVCAYDRPGYGWSAEDNQPFSGDRAVNRLQSLLTAAKLPTPRILVGHSLGGAIVQRYAQRFPEEVSGMVLVDSLDRDQALLAPPKTYEEFKQQFSLTLDAASLASRSGSLRLLGIPATVVLDLLPQEERPSALAGGSRSSAFRTISREFKGEHRLLLDLKQHADPSIPAVVISTKALRNFPPGWDNPEMRALWVAEQSALAQRLQATHVVDADAGHYVALEEPEVVASAVATVIKMEIQSHLPARVKAAIRYTQLLSLRD